MRVLHIVAGGAQGGPEIFCMDTIQELNRQGVTQHVICRPVPGKMKILDAQGIGYNLISFRRYRKWREQNLIRRVVLDFKPDIVHSWMRRASSFVPRDLEIPVVGWFGGYYDLKYYKNCNYYIGITDKTVRHIIRRSGAPHRTFLVHTFGTVGKSEPVSRDAFGLDASSKVVLLLSRMHWKKGIDTLLQAAEGLKDVSFLLAGDGPEFEKYRQEARNRSLNERVKFLGWRTDRSALLNIADIVALPSREESFGTVIPEAWAAKVPIVAARADGPRQYIVHEQNGLLSDIDDADGLKRNIAQIFADSELRNGLIRDGYETYNRQFSRTVVIDKLKSTYRTIISDWKNRPSMAEARSLSLPVSLRDQIVDGLLDKQADLVINKPVLNVATAYLNAFQDLSMAIDAAYLQAKGTFDFRRGFRGEEIEVLGEQAFERLLRNREYLSGSSSLSA